MFRYLLLLSIFFTTYISQAQDKLVFSYDAAGNQTQRNRICISCGSKPAPADEAPTALEEATEDPSIIDQELTAYPNPTSNLVHLQWNNTLETTYTHFEVYSLDGRLVTSKKVEASDTAVQLEFEGLPSGVYLLQAFDSKQRYKIFKILKN